MKIPVEFKMSLNVTESVTKLQKLEKAAYKATEAINDFNMALEKCQKMDLEISINYKTSTKKWYQFWKT